MCELFTRQKINFNLLAYHNILPMLMKACTAGLLNLVMSDLVLETEPADWCSKDTTPQIRCKKSAAPSNLWTFNTRSQHLDIFPPLSILVSIFLPVLLIFKICLQLWKAAISHPWHPEALFHFRRQSLTFEIPIRDIKLCVLTLHFMGTSGVIS